MGYFGSSFTSPGTGVNIEICDVTLRDGEQAPGVVFGMEEKIEIATKLDSIGVEMIEAGFPAVSSKEKAMVKKIANLGLNTKICCLSRAIFHDIDEALECDVDVVGYSWPLLICISNTSTIAHLMKC
jgi:methanogen homocitrate synthase